jgi:hypothetical protein
MKKPILIIICGMVACAVAFGIWVNHKASGKTALTISSTNPTPGIGVRPPSLPPSSPPLLKPNEWQELRSDREAILNANPELASEYKSLLTEMDNQQKDLEAAMIKADPKVAPLVAKIESMRKPVAATSVASPSGKPKPTLTQDDLAQLRTARMAALEANPDFDAKAAQTAAKMRAFQDKLIAAMVKADPSVAPIVAKFSAGHPSLKVTTPPSKTE